MNTTLNMVKAICKDETTRSNLLKNQTIKIGHIRHRVTEFVIKPKLNVCYQCGGFNHFAKSGKCKKNIFIVCSSIKHSRKDFPNKENKELFQCLNCNNNHPATYAGCEHFKNFLSKLNDKLSQNSSKSHPPINIQNDNSICSRRVSVSQKATVNSSSMKNFEIYFANSLKNTNSTVNRILKQHMADQLESLRLN